MKTYILKLKTTSTTNYNLYDGTTLVSDTDLATLFGSAGSAYFTFDFNEGTPTNTTSLTILNSEDTAVMTNTGLEGIAEDRNFKGVWTDSATAFTSFTLLKGVAMDEAELTTLVGMVKNGSPVKVLTPADYDYHYGGQTDDGVALWRLPYGVYSAEDGVKTYHTSISGYYEFTLGAKVILVLPTASASQVTIVVAQGSRTQGDSGIRALTNISRSDGNPQTPPKNYNLTGADYQIITRNSVFNGIVSDTDAINYRAWLEHTPLSAYTGKTLNDKITGLTYSASEFNNIVENA